ncbi:FtsX-like permease family protein [Salinarimonas sp.]|uniref:ABC transporter permease n=1 Tax=Salinarimonas sp. TaxID=2766526 RepID=UPI0032D8D974
MRWVRLAWRNVWRNAGRTAIVLLIVGVGAMSAMLSLGFMLATFYGLQESTILGGVGHIQVSKDEDFLSPREIGALEDWAAADDRVRFGMSRLSFGGLISTGAQTRTLQVMGIEPERERRMSIGFAPVTEGEHLPLDHDPVAPDAVLGKELAQDIGVAPGTLLTLLGTTHDGVLNAVDVSLRGSYTTGVPELDMRQGLTHLETARFLLNTDVTETKVIVLHDTADVESVAAALAQRFPELTVATWSELSPFYGGVVSLYRSVFFVLGAVLSTVIAFSVINVVVLAINERRKEMGTMIALGISRAKIRATFALEGALMGSCGALAGVVLGGLVAFGVTMMGIDMPPPPGRTLQYPLIVDVDLLGGALIVAFFTALTTLVAWAPTYQLERREVVEFLSER